MRRWLKDSLAWLAISLVIGAVAYFAFGLDFLASALIASFALTLNGLIADREDRGTFND